MEDARNDKDKLTKASVAARLKDIKKDPDSADEKKALQAYLTLAENESATGT
jgi:type I restriction enzyme M protein